MPRIHLQVDDLTPNIGLQWYLLSETFPHMRAATAAMCPALALITALALCGRLAHRPLFLAALLCALSALLKPYPSISDVSLYMVRPPFPLLPHAMLMCGFTE